MAATATATTTALRIVLTEWTRGRHGTLPGRLEPRILDLADAHHRAALHALLEAGGFADARFEAETADALAAVEDTLTGRGGAQRIDPVQAAASPLYARGCRVFQQAGDARFFVAPAPRPALFVPGALRAYADEFVLP